jgi:hypothetical protein
MSGPKKAILATAVLIVSLVFVGCQRAGAGGGSTSPTAGLGSSFTLPQGLIEDWAGFDGDTASVVLFDADGLPVHDYGPVEIVGGFFPGLQITAPPQGTLLAMDDLQNELGVTLATTNPDARFQIFEELMINGGLFDMVYRESDEAFIGWLYADRNVVVSAEDDTTIPGTTVIIDLNLVTGWNRFVVTPNLTGSTVRTGSEPAGTRWVMD